MEGKKKPAHHKAATLPSVLVGVAHILKTQFPLQHLFCLMPWIKRPQILLVPVLSNDKHFTFIVLFGLGFFLFVRFRFVCFVFFSGCCRTSLELLLEQKEVILKVWFGFFLVDDSAVLQTAMQ